MRIGAAILCCLGVVALTGCGGAPQEDSAKAGEAFRSMRTEREKLPPRPPVEPPQPEVDVMDEAIERYEKLLLTAPDDPENADEMLALANLYLQKRQDYKRAAQWYLEYANSYLTAEHPQAGLIYIQLLTCYEKLGDNESLLDTCRQMLRVFPPESQEYLYADKMIRGLDVSERVPLPAPEPRVEEGEGVPDASPAAEGESNSPPVAEGEVSSMREVVQDSGAGTAPPS